MASRREPPTKGAAAKPTNRAITRFVLDLAESAEWTKGQLANALKFKQQMYVRYDSGEAVFDATMLLAAITALDIPLVALQRVSAGYGVVERGGVFATRTRREADDAEIALRLAELSDPATRGSALAYFR